MRRGRLPSPSILLPCEPDFISLRIPHGLPLASTIGLVATDGLDRFSLLPFRWLQGACRGGLTDHNHQLFASEGL
jgi:hypothetical protein